MKMEMTTGCDKDGKLTAMRLRLIADTGAYASLGGPVLQRACTHAAGPYNYQNNDIIGTAVYTNNIPCGAFRGFGVVQTMFATECNLNQLAEKVGIDAFEIRYRNALRPGQVLPNGQIADEGTGIVETLEAVKDAYYADYAHAGIACAIKNAGVGVGVPDTGRVKLKKALESHSLAELEGGVIMGLGYGLTEDLQMVEGTPHAKYGTLGLWRATDIPEVETILVEKNQATLAYGAKGVGEIPLIPTSPAVQNTYYKRDGIFRNRLPLEHTAYRK